MRFKKRYILRTLLMTVGLLMAVATTIAMKHYYRLEVSNFRSVDGKPHSYKIYPGTTIDQVLTMMETDYDIGSHRDMLLHARLMRFNYPEAGHYTFDAKIGDRELIERLKLGYQTPVKLTWNNTVRTREMLAGKLGAELMTDSTTLLRYLEDEAFLAQYGMDKETSRCLFIPNTYEVYWTIKPEQLFERMKSEYDKFWTKERLAKAEKLNLTPVEIAILASIIESESNNKKELPIIASLYLNRIKKGMPLQACPTVIYANGDFTLRRVLYRHLEIDSPYNTYKHKGLPPGPIRCPLPRSIDFVLNAPKTNYLFMCANPELNGTHIFSASFNNHVNASVQYHNMMNSK